MIPKPKHLGLEYAEQFKDRSVVEAYRHRPPYPREVFEILSGLICDGPRAVLDVGCGGGDVARGLMGLVERVDAVDFSESMIAEGKRLQGGDHPNLRWIHGPVEEVELYPPYGLVTAGMSLHWMKWDVALPRFREALTSGGYLALTGVGSISCQWDADVKRIITRYSTNRDYEPYNLIEELELRGLFRKVGQRETAPVPFVQTFDDYIEAFHSMNGLSRDRMSEAAASAFDGEVRDLVSAHSSDCRVDLQVAGSVVWGEPGGS